MISQQYSVTVFTPCDVISRNDLNIMSIVHGIYVVAQNFVFIRKHLFKINAISYVKYYTIPFASTYSHSLTHTHRFLTITDSCYHRFAMPCMNSQSNNTIAYKFDWRRVKKNTISTHSTIRFECCCGMWYLSTELF